MKCVFSTRSIGMTLSRQETLDNATYPRARLRKQLSKTKVTRGRVCPITLRIDDECPATIG